MSDFKVHTLESAPADSREMLKQVEQNFDMIPNLAGVMAEAPALLKGYFTLSDIFTESSFSRAECELISLVVSRWNNCHYCVPAHSALARAAGVEGRVVEAVKSGAELPDARLEALRRFVRQMLEERGTPDPEALKAFHEAGFSNANVLEVILGIGLNTLSNYTNHVAETLVDDAFAGEA